ncbi:DUF1353 domain-containing protein [Colwellia sp. PAMC 21821]|uniref:DUF1353 domain-containing protein n=1 Tax=Colwellia sp. PAMC 21821 TaxID=1816219 RepID=UPI0009BE6D3A|nr:DUF1353 domain-containing protein [Colwellia sp. PAMC 21821]ARD45130.1 hypothetical protein A3Q33_12915 [Colwellia sp. PAMC 21821]
MNLINKSTSQKVLLLLIGVLLLLFATSLLVNFFFINDSQLVKEPNIGRDIPKRSPIYITSNKPQKFINSVKTEWAIDDVQMYLLDDFAYVDQFNYLWEAPSGSLIDGASIPKRFWSDTGSPYIGKYRKASVIHDYYCKAQTAPYQDVHNMFLDALSASRVTKEAINIISVVILGTNSCKWDSENSSDYFDKKYSHLLDSPSMHDEASNRLKSFEFSKELSGYQYAPRILEDNEIREIFSWIRTESPSTEQVEMQIKLMQMTNANQINTPKFNELIRKYSFKEKINFKEGKHDDN